MDSRARESLHNDGRPGRSGGDEQRAHRFRRVDDRRGDESLAAADDQGDVGLGGGNSKISIPCSRDPDGIWVCSRSACSAASGATFTSSGSAGAVTFSRRAAHGSAGPCAGVLNA